MTTIVGRDCKIEVALTFDSALTVTALTKADPGVATCNAHGATVGEAGFFTVAAGMVEMDEQAVYLSAVDTNTMTFAGLETTDYSTWSAGTLTLAATWGTLSEAAGYAIGGGAATQLDDTRLLDKKTRNVAGLLAPQDATIDIRNAVINGAALVFMEKKAKLGQSVLVKISKGGNVLRVLYGQPSVAGETVQSGALATGQISITVPGWCVKPNV